MIINTTATDAGMVKIHSIPASGPGGNQAQYGGGSLVIFPLGQPGFQRFEPLDLRPGEILPQHRFTKQHLRERRAA